MNLLQVLADLAKVEVQYVTAELCSVRTQTVPVADFPVVAAHPDTPIFLAYHKNRQWFDTCTNNFCAQPAAWGYLRDLTVIITDPKVSTPPKILLNNTPVRVILKPMHTEEESLFNF